MERSNHNKIKKVLSILIIICIITSVFSSALYVQAKELQNINNVYLITNADELLQFSSHINNLPKSKIPNAVTAVLMNDIDMSGERWVPIGTKENFFTGTFDGNNKTIRNLSIGTSDKPITNTQNIGLFGYSRGYITNVTLESISIYSDSEKARAGGLIGHNAGLILSCTVSGNINAIGDSSNCGFITGVNDGYIRYCQASGNITAGKESKAGGLIGLNYKEILKSCYFGNIQSGENSIIGGLIGDNPGEVYNSFTVSNLSARKDSIVGALIGNNRIAEKTILNKYSTNCYWNSDMNLEIDHQTIDNKKGVAQGEDYTISKSTAEMKSHDFLDLLNKPIFISNGSKKFISTEFFIFTNNKNQEYPILDGTDTRNNMWYYNAKEPVKKNESYYIGTAEELAWVALMTNNDITFPRENVVLTNNIDLKGKIWSPIGAYKTNCFFEGNFIGNGHIISNMTIRSNEIYKGLFGQISLEAAIKDVGLCDVKVLLSSQQDDNYKNQGYEYIGGLVGFNQGTITNCFVTGNIQSEYAYSGLLVGYNVSNNIYNCYTSGSVTANGSTGSLIGKNMGNSKKCYWNKDLMDIGTSSKNEGIVGLTTNELKDETFVTLLNSNADEYKLNLNHWIINKSINDGYPVLEVFSSPDAPSSKPSDDISPTPVPSAGFPVPPKDTHKPYMTGYDNGTFAPDNAITRSEIAVLFSRLSDETLSGDYYKFNDVEPGAWYAKAVEHTCRLNLISGYDEGTFRPLSPITRAEFATILMKFKNLTATGPLPFSDIEGHWANSAISCIYQHGFINGFEDGTFGPDKLMTRAEVTKLINKMLDRKPERDKIDDFINKNNLENGQLFIDVASSHWAYYDIIEATFAHEISDFH